MLLRVHSGSRSAHLGLRLGFSDFPPLLFSFIFSFLFASSNFSSPSTFPFFVYLLFCGCHQRIMRKRLQRGGFMLRLLGFNQRRSQAVAKSMFSFVGEWQ